jgi:hypothetical protein
MEELYEFDEDSLAVLSLSAAKLVLKTGATSPRKRTKA